MSGRTRPQQLFALPAIILSLVTGPVAHGDSLRSRCGYSDSAESTPEAYQACVFSQRQGYISISMAGTTRHEFAPDADIAGNFRDENGEQVYRIAGLGERGQTFQLPEGYLFVLWDPPPSRLDCPAGDLSSTKGCRLGDGNVGFALQTTSGSSLNTLTLTPIGMELDNSTVEVELDGTAYLAELADLDSDGWPEVYLYVSSAGSGSYGSLVAYAVNKGKSATPVYLPPLDSDAEIIKGYQGHDEFRVVENRLVRRFPLYREGDSNSAPSGGTRQVQYRLVAGEAGWQLAVDRTVDY